MLGKISGANTAFKSNRFDESNKSSWLNPKYTLPESRNITVAALGSSRVSAPIAKDIQPSGNIAREIVLAGKNLNHGCCADGFMGSYLYSGRDFSKKDSVTGKPIQNLSIIMNPRYGDEDIEACTVIGNACSEAERIEKFKLTSDHFLIQKGSTATLNEAASIIGENKNVILVGQDYFSGFNQQCSQMFKERYTNQSPEELMVILDNNDPRRILDEINNPKRIINNLENVPKPMEPIAIKETKDAFLVFNGGLETLKKAASLVQINDYTKKGLPIKKVLFVGNFYAGIKAQYNAIVQAKLLKHNLGEIIGFIGMNTAKKLSRIV